VLKPEDDGKSPDTVAREFCEGKIARYKIPKYIFFVKQFPMTGSGKIQKFKLKDLSLELCKQQGIEII
jgi:fatty-acyl-CoA synthase